MVRSQSELVVFSHLRWTFVWQRPQHIVSRLAAGRRTWFVEEPLVAPVDVPTLRSEKSGPVTRVWLEVPGPERHVAFDDPSAETYTEELARMLGHVPDRMAWLYTPLALPHASRLEPSRLVYDVMDDLSSFKDAPAALRLRHLQALRAAHVVFTGGRSLQRRVVNHRPDDTYLFPCGVEIDHFARARAMRARRGTPVAGYVGVIDERLDLDLVGSLAAALHGWEVRMVGPVAKIDPRDLPEGPNLTYTGSAPYERLPEVLAGFDVALMPFALNEATRSISPTKTLEYLAAGLPVVSTRVPDVVADHSSVVMLADDAAGFAAACRRGLSAVKSASASSAADSVLNLHDWDLIVGRMAGLAESARSGMRAPQPEPQPAVEVVS